VRREIAALVPGNVVFRAFGLQEIAEVGSQEILATGVPLLPLIAIAMLLTSAGVYSVLSFAVARRSTELAVRLAVGATRGHIVRSLAAQSARVVAAGLAGGFVATLALARLAQGAGGIFDSPGWPAFVVPAAIVSAIGALATWLPARRAMRIEPSQILRSTGA
jgi:ABC-type antimicrobial peptide transport system permease subunit